MSWEEGIDVNSPTFEFINTNENVIRSVAGPGTGKSFAIKRRIAKLLSEGINPKKILAVTFTRTAAADLKKEISSLDIPGSENVFASTLHSLCMMFLMREDVLSDISRKPRIMFSHEIKTMLYDIRKYDYGNQRDKEKKVNAYEAAWARLQHEDPGYSKNEIDNLFEKELVEWMTFHDCLLIGEVVPLFLKYLQDNPHSEIKTIFDIILIDEYQDLNKAEQEILFELSNLSKIAIVGDDDQSIYSFKHAHPEGIRELPNRYTSCKKIDFNICRRCPKTIVELADYLIQNNEDRTLGHLMPYDENDDGIVHVIQWETLDHEIYGIAEIVENEINNGLNPEDILILTPRRLIGYEIRDIINSKNINAKSYFRENSLPTDNVRYAFALLFYLAHPDDKVVLRYLLGFHSQTKLFNQYSKLKEFSKKYNISINNLLENLYLKEVTLKGISNILKRYIDLKKEKDALKEYILQNKSFIEYFIDNDETTEFDELKTIYEEIINEIDEPDFDNHDELWNWYSDVITRISSSVSMPEVPTDIDHVRIMSLHSSKGLSSKLVILTTAVQQLLNHIPENISEIDSEILKEEQRRLFYVAITRCKCDTNSYPGKLIISSCTKIRGHEALQMGILSKVNQFRKVHASQFIRELGPNLPRTIRGEVLLNN